MKALMKCASITLLTGHSGAGKTTLTKKMGKDYDIVFGSDVGTPQGGRYVRPSKKLRKRLRQHKADQILAAHKSGKKVLVEGYPGGLMKLPGVVHAANEAHVLDVPYKTRRSRVRSRAKQRGSSPLGDLRQMTKIEPGSHKSLEKIVGIVGPKRVIVKRGS